MKRINFEIEGVNFCGLKHGVIMRLMERYTIKRINMHIDLDLCADELFCQVHYGSENKHFIKLLQDKTIYFLDSRRNNSHKDVSITVEPYIDSWFYMGFAFHKDTNVKYAIEKQSAFLIFHKNSNELANFKMRYE